MNKFFFFKQKTAYEIKPSLVGSEMWIRERYYIAKKHPDLERVHVYMENLNHVLPRGEYLPVPLPSSITIGPPIWLENDENKFAFLERAREAILRLKES